MDTGWTCQIWSSQDLPSAEAAAEAFVETPESVDYGVSKSEPFAVPVGTAVLVTLGSLELDPPSRIERLAFVDAPHGVVQIFCGEAAADHVIDVARTIAPLAPDYSPEPFDPRVELADHGFAIDFGPEWTVGFRIPGSRLGGTAVLTAQVTIPEQDGPPLYTCRVEDDSDVPGLQGVSTADDWKAAFIEAAEGRRGRELTTTTTVDLPSGPAIRADWPRYLGGMPTTAYVVSGDGRVVMLICHSERPPEDRRLAIVETLEWLPQEA